MATRFEPMPGMVMILIIFIEISFLVAVIIQTDGFLMVTGEVDETKMN